MNCGMNGIYTNDRMAECDGYAAISSLVWICNAQLVGGTLLLLQPIEKTHLRFCKMFLEVNKKAANHATRAEMRRFPIQISIISLILKYYIYLNGKESNSIVKQALIISQELGSNSHNSYHSKLLEI